MTAVEAAGRKVMRVLRRNDVTKAELARRTELSPGMVNEGMRFAWEVMGQPLVTSGMPGIVTSRPSLDQSLTYEMTTFKGIATRALHGVCVVDFAAAQDGNELVFRSLRRHLVLVAEEAAEAVMLADNARTALRAQAPSSTP